MPKRRWLLVAISVGSIIAAVSGSTPDGPRRVASASGVAGTIDTFAGTGQPGLSGDGAAASAAKLWHPFDVAVDANNVVYIADTQNCVVRRVDNSGLITTIAGRPSTFSNGQCDVRNLPGPTPAMEIDMEPYWLALGSDRAVYVAGGCGILRVSSGVATQLVGDAGCGPLAEGVLDLGFTGEMAVSASNELYFSDACSVRKLSNGIITVIAGVPPTRTQTAPFPTCGFAGDGGLATSALLNGPRGLAFDAQGDLYIADYQNSRIRRVHSGIISTFAGNGVAALSPNDTPVGGASIFPPVGLAINAAGDVFMTEGYTVQKIGSGVIADVAGCYCPPFTDAGDGGRATEATLSGADGISIDRNNNLYIAEIAGNKVRVVHGSPPPPPPSRLRYAALGDSIPCGADLDRNAPQGCSRSAAYPQDFADGFNGTRRVQVNNFSCSGTTSDEMFGKDPCKQNQMKNFARDALANGRFDVTTVSVGADDFIRYALQLSLRCVNTDKTCQLSEVEAKLKRNLHSILSAAAERTGGPVILTTYYNPISPLFLLFDPIEQAYYFRVQSAINELNAIEQQAAAEFAGKVVVVDLSITFANHTWGDQVSWVTPRLECPKAANCDAIPGTHPTARGQREIARDVRAAYDRWLASHPR